MHVVVGEDSEPFLHEGAQALLELLPQATHQVLPGLDHSAFWTAPEPIADLIVAAARGTAARR